jgi:hypothetical protein
MLPNESFCINRFRARDVDTLHMVVNPGGTCYGPVETQNVIDGILDAVEEGEVFEEYLIE